MLKYKFMGIACAITGAILLSGCPGLRPDGAVLFIHNESEDTPIKSIQFRAPGEDEFGPDMLEGDLAAGDSIDFLLEAPLRIQDESGVTYRVRVNYDGLLGVDLMDAATFSCLHAGERTDWNWEPGDNIDNRCVD